MESRNFIARENHVCMVIGSEDELKFNACQGTQEADILIGDDRVIRFMDYASIRLMLACLMQAARELRFGPLPTEEEIVARAGQRTRDRQYFWMVFASLCFGGLLAIYAPVHAWLHAHLQLLLGFLLGTLAQSVPWLIDRWRWMKWFSHQ